MYTFLLVLIFLASIVLIVAVLAQNPKGGGLSSAFGGAGAAQFIGVKKTTDLLEKVTWGSASVIMVLAVVANVVVVPDSSVDPSTLSPNVRKAQEAPALIEEGDNGLLGSDSLTLPGGAERPLELSPEDQ